MIYEYIHVDDDDNEDGDDDDDEKRLTKARRMKSKESFSKSIQVYFIIPYACTYL
jgi:hypothetical protein